MKLVLTFKQTCLSTLSIGYINNYMEIKVEAKFALVSNKGVNQVNKFTIEKT
jgi:hypothetical protein